MPALFSICSLNTTREFCTHIFSYAKDNLIWWWGRRWCPTRQFITVSNYVLHHTCFYLIATRYHTRLFSPVEHGGLFLLEKEITASRTNHQIIHSSRLDFHTCPDGYMNARQCLFSPMFHQQWNCWNFYKCTCLPQSEWSSTYSYKQIASSLPPTSKVKLDKKKISLMFTPIYQISPAACQNFTKAGFLFIIFLHVSLHPKNMEVQEKETSPYWTNFPGQPNELQPT